MQVSVFKNKLAACFCLTSALFIFPANICYSATVTGSYNTTTRGGRGQPNRLFVNTYSYQTQSSVLYDAIPEITVFSRTNRNGTPIRVSFQDQRSTTLSIGAEWNQPININFRAENTASYQITQEFEVAPHTELNVVFRWFGDRILSGGRITRQQVNNFTDQNPIGSPTTRAIGSGFYSLVGNYDFRPRPVPEPLTILGSVTAIALGFATKKEYSKRLKKAQENVPS
ncbi:MAG: PEP-CTERM sorting domain-containing protein [Limnoraphis sp. WC205]|jgi:hypothetical protein|nr:PEP-CTERM sorting domain-containing protein [Limnoraphis sp. WC205]